MINRGDSRSLFPGVEMRVARTRQELERSFALVYREYRRRFYTDEAPIPQRYSVFNALPNTTTFIAYSHDDGIIATATAVPDSPLGLPMDRIYRQELQHLRSSGKKLCEIGMLATDSDFFKERPDELIFNKHAFMLYFFKVIFDYVKDVMRYDYMCIAVLAAQRDIYDSLLFKKLGRVKKYPDVNNVPAQGKYLDVHAVAEGFSQPGYEKLYKIFVEARTDPETFRAKKVLTKKDLEYFFSPENPVYTKISARQKKYLQTCYPAYDLSDFFSRQ